MDIIKTMRKYNCNWTEARKITMQEENIVSPVVAGLAIVLLIGASIAIWLGRTYIEQRTIGYRIVR